MSPELLAEWKRLEDAFHDSLPNQGETGGPSHGKVLCQFLYDNSEAIRAEIERLQAVADRAFDALEYIRRQDGKGPDGLIDWQRCVNRIQEVASTALAAMQEKMG